MRSWPRSRRGLMGWKRVKSEKYFMPKKQDILFRFWDKVLITESCWLWHDASVDGFGYGILGKERGTVRAHRFSWVQYCGPIPQGLCVLHRCDVPECVRPSH